MKPVELPDITFLIACGVVSAAPSCANMPKLPKLVRLKMERDAMVERGLTCLGGVRRNRQHPELKHWKTTGKIYHRLYMRWKRGKRTVKE